MGAVRQTSHRVYKSKYDELYKNIKKLTPLYFILSRVSYVHISREIDIVFCSDTTVHTKIHNHSHRTGLILSQSHYSISHSQ